MSQLHVHVHATGGSIALVKYYMICLLHTKCYKLAVGGSVSLRSDKFWVELPVDYNSSLLRRLKIHIRYLASWCFFSSFLSPSMLCFSPTTRALFLEAAAAITNSHLQPTHARNTELVYGRLQKTCSPRGWKNGGSCRGSSRF